jgi:15-cis-phytoene synthase
MIELQRIAFGYAPPSARPALEALWALDRALGRIVATTTDPMIGQMRLTWWHERLLGLDAGEVVAEPVIAALLAVVQRYDVSGATMAKLVEGWEALLEPMPLGDAVLQDYADKRGEGLFAISAIILGSAVAMGCGCGWALIDLAKHCSDMETGRRASSLARAIFNSVDVAGPKPLRILARIAKAKASMPFEQIAEPVSRWIVLRAVLS